MTAPATVLNIDVPRANLSGTFTVNGFAPMSERFGTGTIRLFDAELFDRVPLGQVHAGGFSGVPIVTGSYQAIFEREATGAGVPSNSAGPLGAVTAGAAAVTIDVPMRTLSGAITVAGAAPPTTGYGNLVLGRVGSADEVILGPTSAGTFSTRAVPGTYLLYYRQVTAASPLPENKNGVIACYRIE